MWKKKGSKPPTRDFANLKNKILVEDIYSCSPTLKQSKLEIEATKPWESKPQPLLGLKQTSGSNICIWPKKYKESSVCSILSAPRSNITYQAPSKKNHPIQNQFFVGALNCCKGNGIHESKGRSVWKRKTARNWWHSNFTSGWWLQPNPLQKIRVISAVEMISYSPLFLEN